MLNFAQNYFCFCSRTFPSHVSTFFQLQWGFYWENGKHSFFWHYNLLGACYNHLVSSAGLHFYSSFQGYLTCPYGPDGHKWPFWPYLVIFGVLGHWFPRKLVPPRTLVPGTLVPLGHWSLGHWFPRKK